MSSCSATMATNRKRKLRRSLWRRAKALAEMDALSGSWVGAQDEFRFLFFKVDVPSFRAYRTRIETREFWQAYENKRIEVPRAFCGKPCSLSDLDFTKHSILQMRSGWRTPKDSTSKPSSIRSSSGARSHLFLRTMTNSSRRSEAGWPRRTLTHPYLHEVVQ